MKTLTNGGKPHICGKIQVHDTKSNEDVHLCSKCNMPVDAPKAPLDDATIELNIIGKLYEDRVIGSFFGLPLTKDRDARFLIVALDYAMKEVERLNKVLKKEL